MKLINDEKRKRTSKYIETKYIEMKTLRFHNLQNL